MKELQAPFPWFGDFNGAAPARARNAVSVSVTAVRFPRTSTGPRPRGRGMNGAKFFTGANTYYFNGAAPARARNAASRRLSRPPTMNFNGAAPARARNEWEDVQMSDIESQLQRGRARAGAECPHLRPRPLPPT